MIVIPTGTDAPIYHWPYATVGLIVLNVALLFAVPLLFAELLIALLIGAPLFDSYLLEFGINDSFALFDLTPQDMISHPLHLQRRLVQPQFPVQLIGTTFELHPQTVMPFSGLVAAFAGTRCPLFQLRESFL